jgi:hypothetical protein
LEEKRAATIGSRKSAIENRQSDRPMPSSSSLPAPRPAPSVPQPLWTFHTVARPRGLALAREKGTLLAWDEHSWLYLLNRRGERQSQVRGAADLAAACCADDDSACAALGSGGEVWWLAPDLMPRWQRTLPSAPLAAALDPFGQYLAVSDARGHLHLFDRQGHAHFRVQTPRPLHHLAFVPEAPRLVGCADFGLVACFDPAGRCVWRDGLVAHVGSLTVSGDGARIVLACFTEGLRLYTLEGGKQGGRQLPEPCRIAAVSFDGSLTLAGGLGNRLLLLDREAKIVSELLLDNPAVALALAPLGDSAVVAQPDGRIVGFSI